MAKAKSEVDWEREWKIRADADALKRVAEMDPSRTKAAQAHIKKEIKEQEKALKAMTAVVAPAKKTRGKK